MEEDNTSFASLTQRLAAIKADVRRLLADRLLQANKIIEERKGVVACRATNKSSCIAAAVDSMGNDRAAAAFGALIGPKLEDLCNSLGVTRFDQIATWRVTDIKEVDAHLGNFTGRITRDEWVAQAKLLAAGKVTEHAKRFGA